MVSISAGLRVPDLSKFPAGSAGLALEPQQTARVKVIARAAADLLRPGITNSAEIDTHVCGQNGPENLCHMTYILLQNFRDLL